MVAVSKRPREGRAAAERKRKRAGDPARRL